MDKRICVFVSSTWEDLQQERQAAERALNHMQDTAFDGMEYFGSRPETPRRVSLSEVDRSDVYVGIFAHRYGSGITEAEYRRAVERGLPCLIYFKDDTVPVLAKYRERKATSVAKLKVLKRELKAKHTLSFFKNPDQLASQVVSDLHNLLQERGFGKGKSPQNLLNYDIKVDNADGIIIGDRNKVTQYFGRSAKKPRNRRKQDSD